VTEINSDPDVFRELLVEKARLPENLAGTFKVDSYPMVTPPAEGDIQDVLDWMKKLGYLSGDVKPADMRYTRP
jgi:NitT/TauT family transport system substrate-binding protein